MVRHTRALVLMSIAWLAWFPTTANACPCVAVGPACQTLWAADAVFSGTVIAIELPGRDQTDLDSVPYRRISMTVSHPYRGVVGERIEIFTSDSSCGYEFIVGETYLVYANRSPESKVLTTGVCSHTTRLIADAQDDLRYLDNLDSIKPGTRVTGAVLHIEDVPGGDDQSRSPAIGFRVRLAGEAGTFEALSDERGQVGFDAVPVGTYTALVVPHAKFAAMFEPITVSLPDARACADLFFAVRYDGRIDGELVGPGREPIAETTVDLRSAVAEHDDGRTYGVGARTDASGRFSLGPVSPGRYLLAIGLEGQSPNDAPYPLIWYPGVTSRDDATVIEVEPGGQVALEPFELPARRRLMLVRGRVVWPRYVRPGEVSVGVWDADTGLLVREAKDASAVGTFEFSLYEGRRYVIKATGARPGTLTLRAQSGAIEPGVEMPEVVLRLTPGN